MSRLLRASSAVAAILVAAMSSLVPAYARGGAEIGDDLASCEGVKIRDGWAVIPSPTYKVADGDAVIVTSAAPVMGERRVFVSNGTGIRLSESAGCKWEYIFPTNDPRVPVPRVSTPVVTHLVAPATTSLWAAMYDVNGSTRRPRVARTTNATYEAGNTTREPLTFIDDGLPLAGSPAGLVVDTDNEHAFLLVDQPYDVDKGRMEPTRALYKVIAGAVVDDVTPARLTWTRVALPPGFTTIEGMVKTPDQPEGLWVWSGSKYAWTTDYGAKWKTATARGEITAIDVNRQGMAAIFSRRRDGGEMRLFRPKTGKVVFTRPTPIAPRFVVHGALYGTYAIATEKRIFGYDTTTGSWVDITPKGAPEFTGLHIGADIDGRILLAETKKALWRFDLFPHETFVPPKPGRPYRGDIERVIGSKLKKAVLTPRRQVVTVQPGGRAPAPIELKVPPGPSPLDVFFLVDTTASMGIAIQGLRESIRNIAHEVEKRTNGQACFGLGEVKDYVPDLGSPTAYALRQKIDCDIAPLEDALREMKQGGGDNVPEEAQTIGLTQAVQGDGHPFPPVLRDQDAKFREGVTKVIVLITDTGFKMEPGYRGFPSMETTIRALNAFHTKVVGVAVQTHNDISTAVTDLEAVAMGTKTVASANGVDCDGDGDRDGQDVAPHAPIVCRTDNYAPAIGPAIVGVLLAVKEPASIGVRANDPHSVVAGVEATRKDGSRAATTEFTKATSVSAIVNIRVENRLDFRAVLTCTKAQAGRDLPVGLSGRVRQQEEATAEIVVRCLDIPVVPPKPPPPPPRVPPPPEPIFPPPKAPLLPAIVPQIQPPPPNNPPGNLNMNAGLSQEEEQEFQLAGVTQNASEQDQGMEEIELAMSGLGDDDAAAATIAFGVAAIGMTIAAGGAMGYRRRTQRRTVPVRVRA